MDRVERIDELAGCIRAWRDRLAPADVGLPAGGRRRARFAMIGALGLQEFASSDAG
jgi:hypothetical protein